VEKNFDAKIIPHISIERCVRCGSVKNGNGWVKNEVISESIDRLLRKNIKITGDVNTEWSFEIYVEDESNYKVLISIVAERDNALAEKRLETKFTIKNTICDICSRIAGDFYASILQVRRNTGFSDKELKVIEGILDKLSTSDGSNMSFVAKRETVRNGYDYYLGSISMGKKASRNIRNTFGGDIKVSSSISGRSDGKDTYRITYCVKLHPFRKDDFIYIDNRVGIISSMSGNIIKVKFLDDGKEKRYDHSTLRESRYLGSDEMVCNGVVISQDRNEAQVLDISTNNIFTIIKPFDITYPKDIKLIKTEYGNFILDSVISEI